jgi:hypothetical protein
MEHCMDLEDLNDRYEALRGELEAAYGAPVWDTERIDRIARDIHAVELALGTLQARAGEEHERPLP